MRLTARDKCLMERLASFGVFSTDQIGDIFFSGIRKTTLLRRLRALNNKGYIHRSAGLDSGLLTWTLTAKGARSIGSALPLKIVNRNTLTHDVTLSNIRLSLARVGVGEHWKSEHELRASSRRPKAYFPSMQIKLDPINVPDAIFGARKNDGVASIAVELELNPKSKRRYEKILKRYAEKTTLFAVWYIVPTASLAELIQKEWAKILSINNKRPHLFCSQLSEVLKNPYDMQVLCKGEYIPMRNIIQMKSNEAKPSESKPAAHDSAHTVSGLNANAA